MIEIKSYGSSSDGNSYLIKEGNAALIIEAGISLKKMKDIDLTKVDGLLVTHEHGDHTKYAKDFIIQTTLDIYCSVGTKEVLAARGLQPYRIKGMQQMNTVKIGEWNVIAFGVEHDALEPVGFLILSPKRQKILFVTDTYYIKYKFENINYLMIECNYSIENINKNVQKGRIDGSLRNRIVTSHFALENVIRFINGLNKQELKEIWLLHLSNTNSNEYLFKKKIIQETGLPVYIA